MKIGDHETHPAADVFPMMGDADYAALRDDIRSNGLRSPVVIYEGLILDGRNRAKACAEIGIDPSLMAYEGTDPVGYVVSLNLRRRHLDESQRAMVAGRIANMAEGRPTETASIEAVSQDVAADLLNVGRASVQRARVVLTRGAPEVVAAVDSGALAVSAAEPLARLPEETQRHVIQKAGGDSRKVRALVREAGGVAPAWGSQAKPREAEVQEEPKPEAPLTDRQRASRELDAKVREKWKLGMTQAEIARALDVHPTTVNLSVHRQGLVKKTHPIQSVEKRAREMADDLASYMGQPGLYFDGADGDDRERCIQSLRALQGAASRAINWLKRGNE